MISTGYRAVWLKRNYGKTNSFNWIDNGITLFAIVFGGGLLALSINNIIMHNMFGIVPGVFGLMFGLCYTGLPIVVWKSISKAGVDVKSYTEDDRCID